MVDFPISIPLFSHVSALLEVQKNCGVVQKDTRYGVTWNFRSASPTAPIPTPQGGSQERAPMCGQIVLILTAARGGREVEVEMHCCSPHSKEKETEAQRKKGAYPTLSKSQRKSQRLGTQCLPNPASKVSAQGLLQGSPSRFEPSQRKFKVLLKVHSIWPPSAIEC